MPSFSCIILAGGEGRRVGGKDKGLIQLDNKTYIEHVINKVKNKITDVIISANRNIESYQTFCDTVISDTDAGAQSNFQGPLAGIIACLAHCENNWVLVLPCDMPYLPADIAEQLYEKITTEDMAIATINNRHQLVLLIKKSLLPTLQESMENNQLKLIRWVESQNYCQVSFDGNAESFRNLNTLQIHQC